jgi:8-oxo-dGTP diphosphatase
MSPQIPTHFRDANYQEVPYDGSPILWRVSIYGIYIKDGKLLVIKNKEEKYYDIPGGGIEMGESFEEALAREGKEEAGWLLKPVKPVWSMSDWFYHSGEKKFYRSLQQFWLAEGEQLPEGLTDPRTVESRLVPIKEAIKLPLYPNVITALAKIPELGL